MMKHQKERKLPHKIITMETNKPSDHCFNSSFDNNNNKNNNNNSPTPMEKRPG